MAAVTLDPATPIAQTPRRSFALSPARISLIMIVLAVPSMTCLIEAPQLMPKMPPQGVPALPLLDVDDSPLTAMLYQPPPALAAKLPRAHPTPATPTLFGLLMLKLTPLFISDGQ